MSARGLLLVEHKWQCECTNRWWRANKETRAGGVSGGQQQRAVTEMEALSAATWWNQPLSQYKVNIESIQSQYTAHKSIQTRRLITVAVTCSQYAVTDTPNMQSVWCDVNVSDTAFHLLTSH